MGKVTTVAAVLLAVCMASPLRAQDYPDRPVRIVVPFSAGGPVDLLARAVAQNLQTDLRQPIVVVNRPGAGGTLGVGEVAKARPDGYTLLVHSSSYAVNPALYTDLSYDPAKDIGEVSPLATLPTVLVVGKALGVQTVRDLITRAKATPGGMAYGSAGTGTITHIISEKFRLAAGLDVLHIPYKGGAEANADTMAGRVAYTFAPASVALPQLREGKLLALGVSSGKRSVQLPDVPTIAESGIAGFDFTVWYGMWAPAGTPGAILDRLADSTARATGSSDTQQRLANLGFEPLSMARQEFSRFVRAEIEEMARVVKAAGIRAQ